MNKIILKYELDLNFILIAITSPLKDYRLCFYINRESGLNLQKEEDYTLQPDGNSTHFFTKYSDISPTEETEFYLLGNRGLEGGILIPEMKNVDFFMVIKGFIDDEDLRALLSSLIKIEDIIVASEIDVTKLKSKENLVF